MTLPCVEPLPLYRPRDPQASALWRVMDRYFPTFQQVYDERYEAKYGFWRPVIDRSVTAFLKCGDLHQGFARVRCPDCQHEMFVAFSCKQRCTCPSCHQKRALLNAIHVAEDVCYMRTWPHSGFSVDQSVFLPAGDLAGIQRLMQYMTRCPFSLSRLIKVTEKRGTGSGPRMSRNLSPYINWHPPMRRLAVAQSRRDFG